MIMMCILEQLERMKCVIFTSCIGSKARNLWIRGFVFHLVCIWFSRIFFAVFLNQKNETIFLGPPWWSWKKNAQLLSIPDEEASTL